MTNHAIEEKDGRVVKRFAARDLGQPLREWRGLSLLADHAPGLAPDPVEFWPDATPPAVVMSRVAGTPLRGGIVRPDQTAALAAAVSLLCGSVPAPLLEKLPLRCWHESEVVREIEGWCAEPLAPGTAPVVGRARAEGLRWLRQADFGRASPPAFGTGDGNLSNFLWDGLRVRVVDFEYSGRSDRAFELAEITEHFSAWVDTEFDAAQFLEHFDLQAVEARRVLQCRRLLALECLHVLSENAWARRINPPGTQERQAERFLALVGPRRSSRRRTLRP